MKSLLIALSLTACLSVMAYAGSSRGVPRTTTGEALQSVDYGGVSYATNSFNAQMTSVTTTLSSTITVLGDSVVYGVLFSSGFCNDFVDVWDSTSVAAIHATIDSKPTVRFYNIYGSSAGVPGAGSNLTCGGPSVLTWPIHFERGIFFRTSTALYNAATLLYRKDGDD